MKTNLNNLPKDLLVKLVSSIREDTEKKYIELLRYCSDDVTYHHCSEKGCDAFAISKYINNTKKYLFTSYDREFNACNFCLKKFCEIHGGVLKCECCQTGVCGRHGDFIKLVNKKCFTCSRILKIICSSCDKTLKTICSSCDDINKSRSNCNS